MTFVIKVFEVSPDYSEFGLSEGFREPIVRINRGVGVSKRFVFQMVPTTPSKTWVGIRVDFRWNKGRW